MIIRLFWGLLHRINLRIQRGNIGTNSWKKKFGHFGCNSKINYPVIISGIQDIHIGDNTTILHNGRIQNYYLGTDTDKIRIGDNCYIGSFFSVLNASNVTIGNDVLIASHVLISSENHGMDPESDIPFMDQPLSSNPVSIADGCWIGENVCILPGVTIGKKCIVGAGSVVTKSIPDYSIAVGNPARVIKKYNFNNHRWEIVI